MACKKCKHRKMKKEILKEYLSHARKYLFIVLLSLFMRVVWYVFIDIETRSYNELLIFTCMSILFIILLFKGLQYAPTNKSALLMMSSFGLLVAPITGYSDNLILFVITAPLIFSLILLFLDLVVGQTFKLNIKTKERPWAK